MKWTVIKFKMLFLFFFKCSNLLLTIKWNDISSSIHQKVFWILSATIMQDQQFPSVSQCLCVSYPEPFLFSAPTLQIKEWKGSWKEFLFLHLLFKSDNISCATFRGGACVNDITKNCGVYCEIPPLLLELFVFSHMTND